MNDGREKQAPGSGRLIVISSPSGGGKTTIVNAVRKNLGLDYSVSFTTRPPRNGEQNGIHYYFVSKEKFLEYIKKGRFAEWAEVHGNFYGTDGKFIRERLMRGKHVLADIDVQGALEIKERFPDALLIFISPPSMEELERRLRTRGSDSEESVRARLAEAAAEMDRAGRYDHTVVNDNLQEAVAMVEEIIKHNIFEKRRTPDDNTD